MSLNWIIDITKQYLEPFNCVQINEKFSLEYLVLNINNYNQFTLHKQMIHIE